MRSFRAAHAAAQWPHPGPRPHVYVPLADRPGVADLAARVHDALVPWTRQGIVAPVPPAWLHLTLGMLQPTAEDADRDALAAALRTHLADVPAFAVRVGSPLVTDAAVLLDVDDADGHLERVYRAVQAALVDEGLDASYDPRPFHATAAYGTGQSDGGPIASRLRRVRPAHADLGVDHVALVDVTQHVDNTGITYTWTTHTVIPLAGQHQVEARSQ